MNTEHQPTTPEELAAADAEFLAGMKDRIAQATRARIAAREHGHQVRMARADRRIQAMNDVESAKASEKE